jgi:hypothetical protein
VDVFHLGGPVAVLDETRTDWLRLKTILDHEAAVPVGYIFGTSANPIDQHQVLAIGYKDPLNEIGTLTVWDNREANKSRDLVLDFRGPELQVGNAFQGEALKCVFIERYSPQKPPSSLRLN